jgi:hypothetical protein
MRVAGFLRKRGVEVVRHNTRPRSITIRRTVLPSSEPDRGCRTNSDNIFVSDRLTEDINLPALPERNSVDNSDDNLPAPGTISPNSAYERGEI